MVGFMLDSARLLESRGYYLRFIDHMAETGCDTLLWHFTDDQGCSLRFDSLPEAASNNAYSKPELRELLAYARDRGVAVIPELETLGHTRYITRSRSDLAELSENDEVFTSLCPVHPRSREVVGLLIDEVCDLFESALVHVGLDEVNFGTHPMTREALASSSSSELFADYIRFVHGRLARHGKRMMMWGDHLLKDPVIAEAIPKDILIANWQYTAKVPDATTPKLTGYGFEVVNCPAMISYDQPLAPGERFALENLRDTARHAREYQTKGVITTIWTPQRFFPDSLWPSAAYAAALMIEGPDALMADVLTRFFEARLGSPVSNGWVNALCELHQVMPMRDPWVAALRVDINELRDDVNLHRTAQQARRIYQALLDDRPDGWLDDRCCRALLLVAELHAHVWERVAAMQIAREDAALLAVSESLGERLSACWDEDRFADDPRKWQPVFPFDRDDHLLIAFDRGTTLLREAVASASRSKA
ncbi:family 20 glycosylhydrolase [Mucisphaera calidilacus]|uniref:beta-N-acetylhexosaminidase n=1 Tax=Mucisphaera calidilacus TaxID=2527982 RepID=A0A518BU10_9BACT|nr:family 20 glycosylhydrolase [Mucisphaera calidilacus]QDU70460.1 Beta-hexosaminidase [Mucisphaera calidilacus]